MRTSAKLVIGAACAVLFAAGLPAQTPGPDPTPLLGQWLLEVNAGEIYMLPFTLKLVDGKLAGTISEQSGMFTDVPLTDLSWDGTTLKWGAKTPTPPEGAERPIKGEFKLDKGNLAGTLVVEELGLTAPVVGTRK
jgi:hypothetical protein